MTDEQQREFFRVHCQAVIDLEFIDPEDETQALDAFSAGDGDGFSLATRFAASARDTESLLRRIENVSPDIAVYLGALDQKIELIAKLLLSQNVAPSASALSDIKLSGSGLSFESSTAYAEESLLRLRMVLLPNYYGVEVLARVLRTEPRPDGSDFTEAVRFESG